ncbi:amino acid ABC transporter permease [Paraburkholderia sp. MPAMCS5]|uniref:amino acid ABC transporter permease n=1 Tax=Paraburkholderia sp. MPAMCS5 TaxID=3112563 RepID=UPI002E19BDA1|nr:amino acid ABC transporter permease [Paraburkholderia sp. MPAMCS5]
MQQYQWDFSILWQYRSLLESAVLMTGKILALSVTFGIIVGLILAPLRMSDKKILSLPAAAIINLIRSIPPLVLVVWAYYCLPILAGIALTSYWTCVIALALYTGVFYAEIFRAGLQSVDHGLIEAGRSVGMTPGAILRRITGPLAFLRILPPFTSQCIMAVKNSVLGSYVAVGEILYEGQRLSTATFRPLEILTCVALLFVVTIMPLTFATGLLERKVLNRYFRR